VADHIPIITSDDGSRLVGKTFHDSAMVRLPIDRVTRVNSLYHASKLWIDPCVDGCDDIEARRSKLGERNAWLDFMSTLPNFKKLGDSAFLSKPNQEQVDQFVKGVMDRCAEYRPAWITVPQLPITEGVGRNKINRALASASGKWKTTTNYAGRLILPLVFTHQEQLNGKTSRNPKVQLAERCYHESQADGVWVVDKSLNDESGSGTLQDKRFPGIISLHEELNDRVTSKVRIGGPYWGLNLVLWAKGLIDHPAIGVGAGFQFFLSGGPARPPKAKIAIPSLRRRVVVSRALEPWFDKAIAKLGPAHPVYAEFEELRGNLDVFFETSRAREQVASFYKQWFDRVATAPRAGRSMALFQDLSAAYALGKSLPPLEGEGTSRRPESVVEPLMLSCL
jgi:hypothetical protein